MQLSVSECAYCPCILGRQVLTWHVILKTLGVVINASKARFVSVTDTSQSDGTQLALKGLFE